MIFRQNPFLHARVGPAQGGGEKFSRGSFPSGFPGRQRREAGFPERPVAREKERETTTQEIVQFFFANIANL